MNDYKETKKRWRLANRDRINQKRRELRAKKKANKMQGKMCASCDILMVGNSYKTWVYCNDCNERFKKFISRIACKKYYKKKQLVND